MKKIIALLLTLGSLFTVTGCRDTKEGSEQSNNSQQEGVATNYTQYISEFENYYDCNIAQVVNKGKQQINEDEKYITQGKGSLKVSSYGDSYEGGVAANNYWTQVMDLAEAKYISLDVYNPNDFELMFKLSVVADGGSTFLTIEKICQPNSWTEVSGIFDSININKSGQKVSSYSFSANNNLGESFEMYLDDFYVEFDCNVEKTGIEKVFAEKEIQYFETLDDMTSGLLFSSSRIGVQRSLNTDSYYARDGFSLRLDVKESAAPRFDEIWSTTQYLYFGLRFEQDYLKKTEISNETKAISMLVYNTNVTRKKAYIKVYDTDGFSAVTSVWCYPETWTEVRLENFGQVKLNNINQLEIYFEGLYTFSEYSLFIDNLQIEEA